ncbi:hypothetical protein [Flavobacterium davisii]|uniref:hypothetical protein n=1 Tax=Flavobacterium davisii TaxID=2906077 RepID=UPI002164BF27|nr:hypothetical protein [Flavobacterium davisii]
MEWKPEFKRNPEKLTDLDFDSLYRLKKTDFFTVEYLSKWFDFYYKKQYSDREYEFTSEDLKNIKITKIICSESITEITLEYKNKDSFYSNFVFDKDKYYKKKITLNEDEIRKYYVSGVYENLEQFKEKLFKISDDFVLEISTKYGVSYNDNLIRYEGSLLVKGGGKLIHYIGEISGFKPLSDFPKEFVVETTNGLDGYMQDVLKDIPDGDVKGIVSPLRNKIMKKLQYGIIREDDIINTLGSDLVIRLSNGKLALKLKEQNSNPDTFDDLIPLSQHIRHKDIFFHPVFSITSAVKKQGKLILELNFDVKGYPSIDRFEKEIVVNL